MVKFGYNSGMCISILQSKAFNFCTILSFFVDNFGFLCFQAIKDSPGFARSEITTRKTELKLEELQEMILEKYPAGETLISDANNKFNRVKPPRINRMEFNF